MTCDDLRNEMPKLQENIHEWLSVRTCLYWHIHEFVIEPPPPRIAPSFIHPEPASGSINLGPVCALPTVPEGGTEDNLVVATFVYQHLANFGPNNTFEDWDLPNRECL